MAKMVCQISNEPGANIVQRQSRLTGADLWVKDTYFEKGYEPRWLVLIYARSLYQKSGWAGLDDQPVLQRIIDKKLYLGAEITPREIIG